MNSLVNEFINFEKNIKNLLRDLNHVPNISTSMGLSQNIGAPMVI
jgi:hypothetical protein